MDWADLNSEQQRSSTFLVAQFVAGEEAVTQDIQPFLRAMAAEGRIGDEMYLTQFCFEEAKHMQVFRLWMDEVGLTSDLHPYVADNPYYRQLFYEELPHSLQVLDSDPSPANQVRASVTYNHVIEGSLALTGYYAWQKVCTTRGILPGMQELVQRIGDDERRHMAWGTFTCRRHVAADDSNWNVVQERMNELLPMALGMIGWVNDQFDEQPYGSIPRSSSPMRRTGHNVVWGRSNPPAGDPSRRSISTTHRRFSRRSSVRRMQRNSRRSPGRTRPSSRKPGGQIMKQAR